MRDDGVNPYYATGFMTALIFWVWPVYLFKSLDVHPATVAVFAALLFLGAGTAAPEFQIRVIAPKHPSRGRPSSMVFACLVIFVVGASTLRRVPRLAGRLIQVRYRVTP